MFLSVIPKNFKNLHTKQALNLVKIVKILTKKDRFFNNNLKQFNFSKKPFCQVKKNLVSFIIKINLTKTNTIVTITDTLGSKKKTFSAGSVNLTKKQKRKQPMALIKIFKKLLFKSTILQKKTVSIEFKNTKPYIERYLFRMLHPVLFIDSIKRYSLRSHNGCRPKKIRRFKRRTKRLIIYN